MSERNRPSQDKRWLASVRRDLDSIADEWVVKPDPRRQSKAEVIEAYLDRLLTDLGEPPATAKPHTCPFCHTEHRP